MTDSPIAISILTLTPSMLSRLNDLLQEGNFWVHSFQDDKGFVDFVTHEYEHLDCLIVDGQDGRRSRRVLEQLYSHNILLPTVILSVNEPPSSTVQATDLSIDQLLHKSVMEINSDDSGVYHEAIRWLPTNHLHSVTLFVEQAIAAFLKLPAQVSEKKALELSFASSEGGSSLIAQQRRLSSKLNERLGYFGVYYKRNPALFLRRMDLNARQVFLAELKEEYRTIILNYFSEESDLNQKIDRYVTTAFFSDVPTAQIVEIHMELMDEFSKQLKLEGRNEEILLDYRLTLIDTLANLCELYRRSIPRSQ